MALDQHRELSPRVLDGPAVEAGPSPRSRWKPALPSSLILPAQALVLLVVLAPTIMILWLSVTAWQPTDGIPWYQAEFNWFWNFDDLWHDARFTDAVLRTVLLVASCVAAEFALAIPLALLFLEDWAWKKIAAALVVLPMMIVPVDAANAFFMLFNDRGPINYLISVISGADFQFAWLGDPNFALLPIALAEIWQWTPLVFLLVLSGFLGAPRNQYRAAIALGASPAGAFLRVVLPHSLPVIGVALLIRGIEAFKIFDLVYILTRGGPGSATETISMYMFNGAFVFFRIGYIAAAALLVLLLIALLCGGLTRLLGRHGAGA
jgi:multiple sugar transport system permease protein